MTAATSLDQSLLYPSPLKEFWQAFSHNKGAVCGLGFMLLMVFCALFSSRIVVAMAAGGVAMSTMGSLMSGDVLSAGRQETAVSEERTRTGRSFFISTPLGFG